MRKPDGAHLFNLSEFPRAGGGSLYTEFYAGDILSIRSDALVISSFSREYSPIPGGLLGALHERFRISLAEGLPEGTQTYSESLHRVPVPPTDSFRRLWILDLRDLFSRQTLTRTELRDKLSLLIRHSADFVEPGVESVSLPLLGTGDQGIPPEDAADETLNLIRRWADTAPGLKHVRVFAYDLKRSPS